MPWTRLFTGLICLTAGMHAAAAGESTSSPRPADAAISFQHDVMPVLSKAGCNMGACHGNKNGKGGFKLSLRGEDPAADFATLTRELSGRRANALDPERSLLLLKPLMQVPHEGGRRFDRRSPEFDILQGWIAAGMPADKLSLSQVVELTARPDTAVLVEPVQNVSLQVTARFSDGETRDVTRLATFEPSSPSVTASPDGVIQARGFCEATVIVRYVDRQVPVRLAFIPARPDFQWSAPDPVNFVDRHVFARLEKLRINPSPVCDDHVFVRRAFLDLLGVPPTADEARRFVLDPQPGKRNRLIDELLERPEYADWWALKWSDLLRNEEKTLDRKGVQNFHAWIRESLAHNKPLDQFVHELIASRGSTYTAPASNFWRAMRDPYMRAESTAQVFLGVRLQCAKCHNHPFDRWSQDDYYAWSNLFSRVEYRVIENRRRDNNDSHEFDGEQVVYMARKGDLKDPRNGGAPPARFLSSSATPISAESDRLLALADWVVRPDNRLFVHTQVNRVWFHLLGQGIVDPIDDFRATNPPSNPELLAALAADFVERRFDVKHLIRTIMRSRTYQLSAAPNDTNRDDETGFSHAREQRLPAESLLDALASVTESPMRFAGYPVGLRATELPGVRGEREREAGQSRTDQFLRLFGKPERLQSCECERTGEATLGQAFQLVSGELINGLLTRNQNRLGRLLNEGRSDPEIVEDLYWAALNRPPDAAEREATLRYLADPNDRRSRLEDVLWALLNSNEFLLRR